MAIARDEADTRTADVNGGYTPTWFERVPPAYWVVGLVLLIMPLLASNFVLFQIFGWAFIIGMIALSLMFLAGYGGMVSLAQMTVAGCAGYMVAIFGDSAIDTISLGWPWWIAIPIALIIATLFGTLCGALAVRTEGIYTIMITLAIAAAFFVLGVGLEWLQGFIEIRVSEVLDMVANAGGAVLGWVAARLGLDAWCAQLERWLGGST